MSKFSKVSEGEILNDKYRVVSLIAEGGMGFTYKGIELSSGKNVALKILYFSKLGDWKVLELFEREVVLLKNIDHPNIPDYIDNFEVDKEGDRLFVLVQEYVEGENLQKIIESGKRFSVEDVAKIFRELLNILKYIHSLQPPVIHRDINPKNIVIGRAGKIYLVDFGAAGHVAKSTFAASGTFVGTIGYMAQEQLYGKTMPATDFYSLGVTIVFLLTAKEPQEFALIDMKLDYKPYTDAPAFLTNAIDSVIEPDLNKRLSNAKDVIRILDGKNVSSYTKGGGNNTGSYFTAATIIGTTISSISKTQTKATKRSLSIIGVMVAIFTIIPILITVFVTRTKMSKRLSNAAREVIRRYANRGVLVPPRRVRQTLNKITALTFSKSGKYMASAGDDDIIRVWNAKEGKLIKKLEGHRREISYMRFTSDEEHIVSIGMDKLVILWDIKKGEVLKHFKVKRVYGGSATLTSDAKYVVSIDYLKKIELINIGTGNVDFSIKSSNYISGKLAVSSNTRFIAFHSSGSEVIVLDKTTLEFNTCKCRMSYVKSIFISDDKLVVTGNESRKTVIEIVDLNKNESVKLYSFDRLYFNDANISDDGSMVVLFGYRKFTIVDIATGRIISEIKTGGFLSGAFASFTPDKKHIIYFAREKVMHLKEIKSGKSVLTFDFD